MEQNCTYVQGASFEKSLFSTFAKVIRQILWFAPAHLIAVFILYMYTTSTFILHTIMDRWNSIPSFLFSHDILWHFSWKKKLNDIKKNHFFCVRNNLHRLNRKLRWSIHAPCVQCKTQHKAMKCGFDSFYSFLLLQHYFGFLRLHTNYRLRNHQECKNVAHCLCKWIIGLISDNGF